MYDMQFDDWIAQKEEDILNDITRIVAIPSVAKKSKNPEYPCGTDCARVLDFALGLAESFGLDTKNYDYYCGSAILPGKTDRKIGVFVHLDTAAVSDVWLSDPFSAYIHDGYIIGCGVQDNKGAAISLLYLLKLLKENQVHLVHTIELVFGCAKKIGMIDIDRYLTSTDAPQLSFVADADFPVCTQEKGCADFKLTCPFEDDFIEDFHAGYDTNAIPDTAFALIKGANYKDVLEKTKNVPNCSVIPAGPFIKISVRTKGGHAAFPFDRTSPIPILAKLLMDIGLVNQARPVLNFLYNVYSSCDGLPFDLYDYLKPSEATTHICSTTSVSKNRFSHTISIRYANIHKSAEVIQKVKKVAKSNGFDCRLVSNTDPWTPDPFPLSMSSFLTNMANKYSGTKLSPYSMGGTTYAHKLPNAIPFGPNRIRESFPIMYGIGHIANEAIFIEDLMTLIKVYAATIIEIDKMF